MKIYKEYPNGERAEILSYSIIKEEECHNDEYYNIVCYENDEIKWSIATFNRYDVKKEFSSGRYLVDGDFYILQDFGEYYVTGKFACFGDAANFLDLQKDGYIVARYLENETACDVEYKVSIYHRLPYSDMTTEIHSCNNYANAMTRLGMLPESMEYLLLEEIIVDGERKELKYRVVKKDEDDKYQVSVVVTVYLTNKETTHTSVAYTTDSWENAMSYLDMAPVGSYLILEETYIDNDRVSLCQQFFEV